MARTKQAEGSRHSDELTLRLDGALITPDDFNRAVRAFTDLLIQVTEEFNKTGKKPTWNMSVREGSTVLVARPVAAASSTHPAKETIATLRSGLSKIQKGETDVPYFNREALKATRTLATLTSESGKPGITTVQIANGDGRKLEMTRDIAENLNALLVLRKAQGSIEGRLQTISDKGTFQFVVFDALTEKGVNCFVTKEIFKKAYEAFGKRVGVSGEISYDRRGRPVAIRVSGIRVFRELNEMPPIEHFCGILKKP